MNVGVIDLETSKKPILNPWMRGAYLSTVGLKMYLDSTPGEYTYKEWVWYHGETPNITQEDRLQIVFEIQEEIDKLGPTGLLVGHNVKFDINWLKHINVDVSHVRLWCTQQAEFMLSGQDIPISQQGLSDCCERWGVATKTDVVKTYWDAGRDTHEIPLKRILLPYMKNDIDITAELFKSQWTQARAKTKLMKLIRVRQDCIHVLTDIELNGMPFDKDLAEHHVEKFTEELDVTNAELITYIGRGDINLNSGPELSAALFGGRLKRTRYVPEVYTRNCTRKVPYNFTYRSGKKKGMTYIKYKSVTLRELTCKKRKEDYEVPIKGLGFTPGDKTETKTVGVFQTNKSQLKNMKCNNRGGTTIQLKKRILELLTHRSKIAQFVETFVGDGSGTGLLYKASLNADGWLHPNYNNTIAKTGRLSSSGPNGQNFPRSKEDEDGFTNPLKAVFIPSRKGGVILVIDLSQLEWRMAAWLSQDPVAMQEIRDGVDCHLDNAIRFFGDAKYRQAAKIMTFRLLYGGGAYAFYMDPLMPDFTLKKWNSIVDKYNRKYVVLQSWQQSNITLVGQNDGWLDSPTGRVYRIPMEEHKKHPGLMIYKETCIKNYPVQGGATGDLVPLAMHVMSKRMQLNPSAYMSTNWIGQVHDSIIFDTMPHEVKRVAKLGIGVFEDLPGIVSKYWGVDFNLPLTGEATWGPSYADQSTSVKHEGGLWILK